MSEKKLELIEVNKIYILNPRIRNEMIAKEIRKNIEDTPIYTEDGSETRITVSIGVNSVIPGSDAPSDDFISKADQALYKAKESGRNKVIRAWRAAPSWE